MTQKNEMELIFDSLSVNEGFARVAVASFLTQLNPTVEEVSDVKTAVSEAVTNAIIHGYEKEVKKIRIHCVLEEGNLYIEVEDHGKGIEDIPKAMEPLFTTKPELERSGMGFSFMEAFMDEVTVISPLKTVGFTDDAPAQTAGATADVVEEPPRAVGTIDDVAEESPRAAGATADVTEESPRAAGATADVTEESPRAAVQGTCVRMKKTIGKGRKLWTTQSS